MASAGQYESAFAASRHHGRRSHGAEQAESWTLMLVDGGIASAIIIVSFFMGGRTALGQFAFVCVAFWASFWWAVHQTIGAGDRRWHNTLAFLPMALGVVLVLLQVVALPPIAIQTISPQIYETLPLWRPSSGETITLGTWHTLSLTPEITGQSLYLLLSGILLFTVVVQRIERVSDVERIIRWLAISVSLMAAFGVIQFLSSNGKFFWFYEHPYSDTKGCVKGAFTNRNHFAQFIAFGFGAVLWWVYGAQSGPSRRSSSRTEFRVSSSNAALRRTLKVLLVPLCALAVLMSFSRGGVLALLVSCVAALFLLLHAGRLSRRTFAMLVGSGIAVCLGLSIFGYDALSGRFESAKSFASLDDRGRLWAAAREGCGDHLVCGTGLTSHRSVYPMYLAPEPGEGQNVVYTHAENGYVQVALETGIIGLTLALIVIGFYFFWCAATLTGQSDHRKQLCFVALLPALLANAVHSACDFVWYVPGCMGIVVILGACACRLYQLERGSVEGGTSGWRLPRPVWAGMTLALIGTGVIALPMFWNGFQAEVPWNRYLALKRSLVDLNRTTPSDQVAAQSEARKEILAGQLAELSKVLGARPNWAYAHACKAEVHRDLFHEFQSTAENEFDLRMIRETIRDNFDSVTDAREWLLRAIGKHVSHLDAALSHTHRAVELDPLQGEVYATLAQLSFLEAPPHPGKSAYIDQAFRVRPYDGEVLFEVGNEMTLAGRPDQALAYLKRSFACGPEHEERLLQSLAGNVPAGLFLREFQPDADALHRMVEHYQRPELAGELEEVLTAHALASEAKARGLSGVEAAKYWIRAASSYKKLENGPRRCECLQHAIAADSVNFGARLALGRQYLAIEEFAQAEEQLRWCVQRRPGHPEAERFLERAVRERIAISSQRSSVREAVRPFKSISR